MAGQDEFSAAVQDVVADAVAAVKPRLRGWLHAATFPLALVAGIVLVVPGADGARGHGGRRGLRRQRGAAVRRQRALPPRRRGHRGPHGVLKRLDHSNIFLIIAGTYTPFALLLLDADGGARAAAGVVWVGALAGVAFRCSGSGAPRWLYTPVYLALGWVAVFYLPDVLRARAARRCSCCSSSAGCSTASAASSTASSDRTRRRAGSASTRCSTRSRSRRSSCTTSRCRWQPSCRHDGGRLSVR